MMRFYLTLSTLGKIFGSRQTDDIFLIFRENRFDISCKLSAALATICKKCQNPFSIGDNLLKCQTCFLRKIRKNIIGLSSAELAQRVVKVK